MTSMTESSYSVGDTFRARRGAPPWDEFAEVSVLSAMLMDSAAVMKALELLSDDMFYAEKHRKMFRGAVAVAERGSVVDPVTLCDYLRARGELDAVGGTEYVIEVSGSVPTVANVEYHARIVREKAARRRLIELAVNAADAAASSDRLVPEIAADLQSAVLPLAVDSSRTGFVRVKEDLWAVVQRIEEAGRSGDNPRVVPTGYSEIDDNISGGFGRGHFVVVAGVPGSGKTVAAINIGLNVSLEQKTGVLFVSAEMTREQLIHRGLANLGRLPLRSLRTGKLVNDEYPRLARAAGIFSSALLWTDETPTPSIEDVVAKCRTKKSEHPEIGLVIVDFIQLVQRRMAHTRSSDSNRSAELTAISYTLGGMAKELDVAVLATAQVDAQAVEKREDKRPHISDIRWSQGMREAANLAATVYRPKMYDPQVADTLELSFQKGRDDPPFVATFDYVGQYMLMQQVRQYALRSTDQEQGFPR
jgi:replicative DNA helicase